LAQAILSQAFLARAILAFTLQELKHRRIPRLNSGHPQEKPMLPFQNQELLLVMAEFFGFADAACLAIASVCTLRQLEAANRLLSSRFKGIELFGRRPFKGAVFQQLQELMQPQLLLKLSCYSCHPTCRAERISLAVDTSKCCFVSFRVLCKSSADGIGVGVVDAAEVQKHPENLCDPRCRRSGAFAIACDPRFGIIHLPTDAFVRMRGKQIRPPTCLRAEVLGWGGAGEVPGIPDVFANWIGIQIQHGTLEYIRQGPDCWESTGVVCDQLPAKVLFCAFSSGYVGEAWVTVEEFCVNETPFQNTWRANDVKTLEVTPWFSYPCDMSRATA